MDKNTTRGSLTSIIQNEENLYDGDLAHYLRSVFFSARNLYNPYHNFRHIFHVLWLCHDACLHYKHNLSKRQIRNLFIAALFHDFDHTGRLGNDDINIELAIRGLKKWIAPEDADHLDQIIELIKATQYPYVVPEEALELPGQILRDADMSQCFSVAWIQQVVFGLSEEWNMPPIELFRKQIPFLRALKFHTGWAKEKFGPDIDGKINEVSEFLNILDFGTDPKLAVKK
jgi:hypothetical protein